MTGITGCCARAAKGQAAAPATVRMNSRRFICAPERFGVRQNLSQPKNHATRVQLRDLETQMSQLGQKATCWPKSELFTLEYRFPVGGLFCHVRATTQRRTFISGPLTSALCPNIGSL